MIGEFKFEWPLEVGARRQGKL